MNHPVIRPDDGFVRAARRREWQGSAAAWCAAALPWVRPAGLAMTVFAAPFYVVGTLAAGIAGVALMIEKPEAARRSLSVAAVAFIAGLPVGVGGTISIGPVSPSFPGWAMLMAHVMLGIIPIAAALAAHALSASAVDYRRQEWGRQQSSRPSYGTRRRASDSPNAPD
jgi:hypothetical protein